LPDEPPQLAKRNGSDQEPPKVTAWQPPLAGFELHPVLENRDNFVAPQHLCEDKSVITRVRLGAPNGFELGLVE